MYYYFITLRDREGKVLRNKNGLPITFDFTDDETCENFVNMVCREEAEKYLSICQEGTEVEINVRFLNKASSTYATL